MDKEPHTLDSSKRCTLCNKNELDDLKHFLIDCRIFDGNRAIFGRLALNVTLRLGLMS